MSLKDDIEVAEPIARMLRYYVQNRRYGYIDRLANAYKPEVAIVVLEEALREARSAQGIGERVYVPSEEETRAFMRRVMEDMSIVKVVAALALSYGVRRGEGV